MQKVESSRTGTWESIESIELSRSIASISTFRVHIKFTVLHSAQGKTCFITHYRRLRQEVVTRWNSVLEMVYSLLCHKEEVNEALKRTGNYEIVLKSLDWNILSQVCRLLEALKTLTDAASGPFVGLSIIPCTDPSKSYNSMCNVGVGLH